MAADEPPSPPLPTRRSRPSPHSGDAPVSPSHRPSSCVVPFSWEHRPGIPKNPGRRGAHQDPLLPLPPPARKRPPARRSASDPFALAMAECAKDGKAADRVVGLAGLLGSCKAAASACSVVDSAVAVPRPIPRSGGSSGPGEPPAK